MTGSEAFDKLAKSIQAEVMINMRTNDILEHENTIKRLKVEIEGHQQLVNEVQTNKSEYLDLIFQDSRLVCDLIFVLGYPLTKEQQQFLYEIHKKDFLNYACGKWKRLVRYCAIFNDVIGPEEHKQLVGRIRGVNQIAPLKEVIEKVTSLPPDLKKKVQYHIDRLESIEVMNKLAN